LAIRAPFVFGDHDADQRWLADFGAVANLVSWLASRRADIWRCPGSGWSARSIATRAPSFRCIATASSWSRPGAASCISTSTCDQGLGEDHDINVAGAERLPISEAERSSGTRSVWYADYVDNAGTATITVRSENQSFGP
jgi:hypothetical protein